MEESSMVGNTIGYHVYFDDDGSSFSNKLDECSDGARKIGITRNNIC